MKIKDIKLKDVDRGAVYFYQDDSNTKIQEIKLKKKFIPENSGYFLITGKIKINDGTVYHAILGVSSEDSGELFDVFFFVDGMWVGQNSKYFLKILNKKKEEVFPYIYHLNVKVRGDANVSQQF